MSGSDITHKKYASVAQSVEQGTENPRVGGSIPPRGTKAKDRDRAGVAQLAEQLICNQQVAGSIPVTSSNKGRFPSGQREQTVNLPTMSSVVRIHPFPPLKKAPKNRVPFSVVGRGGLPNHGALARGSAVRRRRQLSRSCCQPALEGEKREANLHPPPFEEAPNLWCRLFALRRGGLTNYGPKRAWFGCPPKAAAFAKLLPTGFRRRKAGSKPPPLTKGTQK